MTEEFLGIDDTELLTPIYTYNNVKSDNKIEIHIGSLQKTEKRVWVKSTAKRKGHYRKVKGAKPKEEIKEVAEKPGVSEMVPDNGRISTMP